jgi:GNAT superfamily N-acetyltransferase
MQPVIDVADAFPSEVLAAISAGLVEANTRLVGPSQRRLLAVVAREPSENQQTGGLAGGLIGYTAWGWLYIERLWVAEAWRGGGLGGRLVAAAEDEAVHRGCCDAWIDTFNPEALRLYERLDYAVFGALDNFPPGHTRSFLRKRLGTCRNPPSAAPA